VSSNTKWLPIAAVSRVVTKVSKIYTPYTWLMSFSKCLHCTCNQGRAEGEERGDGHGHPSQGATKE